MLHTEIILSGILAACCYGIQLFLGLKKYREDFKTKYGDDQKKNFEDAGVNEKTIHSKAIQYPGYLIRYTLGGFVITFHLLIFIGFILRLGWRYLYTLGWILKYLLPIVILYILQSLVAELSALLVGTRYHLDPEILNMAESSSTPDTRVHRPQWRDYLRDILQYFILVASKTLSHEHDQ